MTSSFTYKNSLRNEPEKLVGKLVKVHRYPQAATKFSYTRPNRSFIKGFLGKNWEKLNSGWAISEHQPHTKIMNNTVVLVVAANDHISLIAHGDQFYIIFTAQIKEVVQ